MNLINVNMRLKKYGPLPTWHLVAWRTTLLFSSFTGALLTLFSILDVTPFKFEKEEDSTNFCRVFLWKICVRLTRFYKIDLSGLAPKVYTDICFDDYYPEYAEIWFNGFRGCLAAAAGLDCLAFLGLLMQIMFTKNAARRNYGGPAFCLLLAPGLIMSGNAIMHSYWVFDFIGKIRENYIGWTEETAYSEYEGAPYYMTWAAAGWSFFNFILCVLCGRIDSRFVHNITPGTKPLIGGGNVRIPSENVLQTSSQKALLAHGASSAQNVEYGLDNVEAAEINNNIPRSDESEGSFDEEENESAYDDKDSKLSKAESFEVL